MHFVYLGKVKFATNYCGSSLWCRLCKIVLRRWVFNTGHIPQTRSPCSTNEQPRQRFFLDMKQHFCKVIRVRGFCVVYLSIAQ